MASPFKEELKKFLGEHPLMDLTEVEMQDVLESEAISEVVLEIQPPAVDESVFGMTKKEVSVTVQCADGTSWNSSSEKFVKLQKAIHLSCQKWNGNATQEQEIAMDLFRKTL